MPAHQGARARARAEITAEIVEEARRQLAVDGAAGLSLRSVARELGMVSSAVYRYVASRDELLTLLIIEAYNALGAVAERAALDHRDAPPADRFVAVATAIRVWALAHPHEYALVYGSPVPGYAAPEDTITPAIRVSRALASVVIDAHRAGRVEPVPGPPAPITPALSDDLARVADVLAHADQAEDATQPDSGETATAPVDEQTTLRLLTAWTQIFGLISFELFGQTAGAVVAHDDLFHATTTAMASHLGLPSDAAAGSSGNSSGSNTTTPSRSSTP